MAYGDGLRGSERFGGPHSAFGGSLSAYRSFEAGAAGGSRRGGVVPVPGNTQGNPSTETEEEEEERGLVSSIPASRLAGTQYPAPHAAPPSTCLRRFATSDATQLACLISGWLSLHVLYSFSRQRYKSGLANAQTSR